MVFIGGPRQCGKTTFALSILKEYGDPAGSYFNWDHESDRMLIRRLAWNEKSPLIVFDELHKLSRWKTWIKGVYDKTVFPVLGTQKPLPQSYLVTGSARLDVYRRGGDSLVGRYHYWRLHPFTLSELPSGWTPEAALERLMKVGGFPEPFLGGDEEAASRWRRERHSRVIKDDLRDLEQIRDISRAELLLSLLRERVGGMISLNNLAQDLEVASKTVRHWVDLFERMYLVFSVRPFSSRSSARSIKKMAKIFFYDNGDVTGDEGARFENLVATSLLKELQFREDRSGESYQLQYIRDLEKREVDFVVVKGRKAVALVEAKWAETEPSPSLSYYSKKYPGIPAIQIVGQLKYPRSREGIRIVPAIEALRDFSWIA